METKAEEIARLQREIGERQSRLQFLVLGDPCESVTFKTNDLPQGHWLLFPGEPGFAANKYGASP